MHLGGGSIKLGWNGCGYGEESLASQWGIHRVYLVSGYEEAELYA